MKNLLIISTLLAISTLASAQKFTIKGQLMDSVNNPLPSATVLLLNPKDSSLVNFGVSDSQGNFELRNVSKGEHLFKVTFVGFRSLTKKIVTPESGSLIELGKINLEPVSKELAAIEIQGERAPVTVKQDTIEFNAGSFKTKQNAMVEDLLKKLPGVEVDNDGNISAQGEQVRKVTVDGKNFFGTDPKLATRNLPADAVDKVQVFDKKSDQAVFSGIDDGQREKTINLELKEEKRNGAFGNMMAGAGTDDRLQARASINRFSKGRQLSFLGMGNNVNVQGFSMDEYMNFTGGLQQMMGGGQIRIEVGGNNQGGVPLNFGNRANGIMTNYAGGVNLNNEFNKKTELHGSYFVNYLNHDKDQTTFRETVLPADNISPENRKLTYNQNSRQQNTNINHRVNLTLDHKIDSANSLKLTTGLTYNETDSETRSTSENLNPDNSLQNESQRLSLASGSNASLNATLLWRHKFNKKGRTLSANFQLGLSENNREGFLDAINTFYQPDSISYIQQTNQQATVNSSYGATLSYTEPLGNRRYLEANYNFRQNLNDVDREVYDVNNEEPEFNSALSNKYNSDYQYHRAGLNFRVTRTNYNFVAGGSLQKTNLKGDNELLGSSINRSFSNLLPTVRFNYDFSNTKHLRFDYETSVQEPTIQQLQPVVDNSDPLNVYIGNPSLRPAYSQSWRLNFTTFDPMKFLSFFAFVDVDHTTNAITNSQTIDRQLVRTTAPVNVSDNMSISGNANVGFPIQKLGSRFNIGTTFRQQKSIALLNDRENNTIQQNLRGNIRYTFRYKEIFDLSLNAELDRQLTQYEFDQQDQAFFNQTYGSEANLTFLKNYQFSGNFDYLIYESKSTDYNRAIPLLNLSFSRFFLKNKSGELKFSANNLLDKALGVNQTTGINYIERQTTNSLGRYFMLSFTYSLNKQLNPMGMRRGGMMRIMR